MGTDPRVANEELRLDVSPLRTGSLRLSWPGVSGQTYEILSTTDLGATWTSNVIDGEFPETERVLNSTMEARQFFQIREFEVGP